MSTRRSRKRGTRVAERVGIPAVVSTTTPEIKILSDDLTRFMVAHIDDSPEQSLAIAKARVKGSIAVNKADLPVWQTARSHLTFDATDFQSSPEWLQYVAEQLPRDVAVRRDLPRILTLCKAVALCRKFWSGAPLQIEFADYCVAYKILEPVLRSKLQTSPREALKIAEAAARLNQRYKRGVSAQEIAKELKCDKSWVYKHKDLASQHGLIEFEPGTRERNLKLIRGKPETLGRFLPTPKRVLRHNREIRRKVKYVDPFTGTWKQVRK